MFMFPYVLLLLAAEKLIKRRLFCTVCDSVVHLNTFEFLVTKGKRTPSAT